MAKARRQVGLTAQMEQNMHIPDQLQEDGLLAPGSVRPIHKADVHIVEPDGAELCLDLRVHTVALDSHIGRAGNFSEQNM